MITIPQLVEEYVAQTPYIEEALSRDLINYSALARELQPVFEKKLLKVVRTGSVIMALQRLAVRLKSRTDRTLSSRLNQVLNKLGDITVRSNIVEFTFINSPTLVEKQRRMMHEVEDQPNTFLTITDGVFETTFFASSNLAEKIEQVFSGEILKNKQTGLSSLTIIIPEEASEIPGVYYSLLKQLAWSGINFVEVVSSFTELTIFVSNDNVERAFSALKIAKY